VIHSGQKGWPWVAVDDDPAHYLASVRVIGQGLRQGGCWARKAGGWDLGHDIRLLLDRALWARFGERVLRSPIEIQWLSDNGGPYISTETVLYAELLGFKPITTPAYSPESNGMAEAFVNTIKRDYVGGADLSDAATVIRQLPAWLEDYNRVAPHSALGSLAPKEFRAQQSQNHGV
jgi:putative transposase